MRSTDVLKDARGHLPPALLLCFGLLAAGCPSTPREPVDPPVPEDCPFVVEGYRDEDRDGVGAGPLQKVCSQRPAPTLGGLATEAGDCAPLDSTRWRTVSGLFQDEDGDLATSGAAREACVGAHPEQQGFRTLKDTEDCNDSDPSRWREWHMYADTDGDGAGEGSQVTLCATDFEPVGYVATATDCAPGDGTRWQQLPYAFRDADGDARTREQRGTVCAGRELPAGYALLPSSLEDDCADTDALRWDFVDRYLDQDGDGTGSGPRITLCVGQATDTDYVEWDGDCAAEDPTRWMVRDFTYRDADGDGAHVAAQGSVCSGAALPAGYATRASSMDCDDTSERVWKAWQVYVDTDGDSVGTGLAENLCATDTRPAGYGEGANDCAPGDGTRWKLLAFSHRDADGDSRWVSSIGSECSGEALPDGYSTTGGAPDCNDLDNTVWDGFDSYPDTDKDGVGSGEPVARCTNGSVPEGYVRVGGDCAADDGTRWQYLAHTHVDVDGDGDTVASQGQVCSGATLLRPYLTRAHGNDCDDSTPTRWRWLVVYPDRDKDGVGTLAREVRCLGEALPEDFTERGGDADDANGAVQDEPDEEDLLTFFLDS